MSKGKSFLPEGSWDGGGNLEAEEEKPVRKNVIVEARQHEGIVICCRKDDVLISKHLYMGRRESLFQREMTN